MKQNLYYQATRKRENVIKQTIIGLFSLFSSYPRLLLEVFIRKDFGERYFNWGSALIATIVFAYIPRLIYSISAFVNGHWATNQEFFKQYGLWYVYLAAALFMSFKRWREMRRAPGVFDFARYSLSRGTINPFFFDLPVFKQKPTVRTVEILIEPGLFFLVGILLWLVGQGAGLMLIICSIFYCFSYWSDYTMGDGFIMDIIDIRILNEDMEKDFLQDDIDPTNPRASDFRGRMPQDKRHREIILDAIIIDNDDETMAV